MNLILSFFISIEQSIPLLPKSTSTRNRASPGLIRSSSLESIPKILDERESSNATTIHDGEQKRQAKLRSRACNDSFRQAVDKSYGHNSNLNDEGKSTRFCIISDIDVSSLNRK